MATTDSEQVLDIARQVQRNCDISDAQYSGSFSLCTFLLLIRNYYKWTHHLEPWQEGDSADTLSWIEEKENLWEEGIEKEYSKIESNGCSFDPFALEEINGILEDASLQYGAGYSYGMKPTFFLAHKDDTRIIAGNEVIFLGREYARDMPALPALRQAGRIYLRRESARYYLYDRITERFLSGKKPMLWAMKQFGVEEYGGLPSRLDRIVDAELMTMAHHEVGEAAVDVFGDAWGKIVSRFAATPVERFARSLRDVLADTHPLGLLSHLATEEKAGSLGIYTAFQDGFARLLFPEIRGAFDRFVESGDWGLIEEARVAGHNRLLGMARELTELENGSGEENDEEARKRIETVLINPLYCDNYVPSD